MSKSRRSSGTSVPCRLEWRPSRQVGALLFALALLAQVFDEFERHRGRRAQKSWERGARERHGGGAEDEAGAAQEGSGNPQGVLYLKLSAHGTALSKLVVGGFSYTRRLLGHLQQRWGEHGVAVYATHPRLGRDAWGP